MAKRNTPARKNKQLPGGNLPVQLTTFIGRRQELERVRQLIATSRLLTLTGAGGCGKTRLALRSLEDFSRACTFKDGAFWVDLALLNDPSLLPQAVASSLALQEKTGEDLTETIVSNLTGKRMLLALDNCEHMKASCAPLVELILRSCPNLKILTTSREPLGVPGEVSWLVPSLSFLEARASRPGIPELERYDAVQLFIDRANAVSPGFTLTDLNSSAVLQICSRLGSRNKRSKSRPVKGVLPLSPQREGKITGLAG